MIATANKKTNNFNKSWFVQKKSPIKTHDIKETEYLTNDVSQNIVSPIKIDALDSGTHEHELVELSGQLNEPHYTTDIVPTHEPKQATILDNVVLKVTEPEVYIPIPQELWAKEDQILIDWFNLHKDTLPTKHYRLTFSPTRVRDVFHPVSWYNKLSEEIERGPQGNQAKYGLLQEDLRVLKAYVERFDNIGKR